jgi:siroheme synthase (precorrin-2 oxidase/ferrochelatase)
MSNDQVSDAFTVAAATRAGKNRLFPVFLKIEELNVLLVGGGKVGLEKLNAILQNGPDTAVCVVATEINNDIKLIAAAHPAVVCGDCCSKR